MTTSPATVRQNREPPTSAFVAQIGRINLSADSATVVSGEDLEIVISRR